MQASDASPSEASSASISTGKGTIELRCGFQRTLSISGESVTDSNRAMELLRATWFVARGAPDLAIPTNDSGVTLEPAPSEHISANALPGDALCRRVAEKLEKLERAVSQDDEVEVHAIGASIRYDLKDLRRAWQPHQHRRFALGYIYDALSFTPPKAISRDAVDAVKKAFAAASSEALTRDALLDIRDALDAAGLELQPQSST